MKSFEEVKPIELMDEEIREAFKDQPADLTDNHIGDIWRRVQARKLIAMVKAAPAPGAAGDQG